MDSMNRRVFLQGSTALVTVSCLTELGFPLRLLADPMPPIPGGVPVPAGYAAQPGLMALRADLLYQQIARGYGYYGQPRNWVPLWSYAQLTDNTQKILQNAAPAWDYIQQLRNSVDAARVKQENYQKASAAATDLQTQLRDEIQRLAASLPDLKVTIDSLLVQIGQENAAVFQAQSHFNDAVLAHAGNGCSFSEIIGIVGAVVAVVAAAFTAGAALVAAYEAIGDLALSGVTAYFTLGEGAVSLFTQLKDDYTKFKPLVSNVEVAIQTVENDATILATKYDKLKDQLATNPDSALVIVDSTQFDTLTTAKLAEFTQAVQGAEGVPQDIKDKLIDAGTKYFHLVQLRNQKILEYDGAIMTIRSDARAYYELGIEVLKLDAANNADLQHFMDAQSFLDSMTKIQTSQMSYLTRSIWEEKRAYAFSVMDQSVISDDTMQSLKLWTVLPDQLQQQNQVLIRAGQSADTALFDTTSYNPSIAATVHLTDRDRETFAQTRQFHFVLSPNNFSAQDRRSFLLDALGTGFKITCNPPLPDFNGALTHVGHHRFLKSTDGSKPDAVFSSYAVRRGIQTGQMPGFTDIRNIPSTFELTGVSILGDWVLSGNAGTETMINTLQSFTISFTGTYASLNQPLLRRLARRSALEAERVRRLHQ